MAALFFFFFCWLVIKACKAFFRSLKYRKRKPGKQRTNQYEPDAMPDPSSGELQALYNARSSIQESIDYINGIFIQDDIRMSEKDVLYLINRQSALYKQLAAIEKQIAKVNK